MNLFLRDAVHSRLTPHASRLTPHASRLTPHASRLTPHASRLTPRASRLEQPLRLLPQQILLNLARRRFREWAEHHALGNFEAGQTRAAIRDHLCGGEIRGTRLQRDERARALAPLRIRLRDDGCLQDRRVAV